jgi:hypothetical protein
MKGTLSKKAVTRPPHAHLRVGLGVLEDAEQRLRGLLGPPPLAVGGALVLGLRRAAHAAAEAAEDDAAAHRDHLLEVMLRGRQVHLLDRHRRLAHVLEVRAQVRRARLAGLGRVHGLGGVLHHSASLGVKGVRGRVSERVKEELLHGFFFAVLFSAKPKRRQSRQTLEIDQLITLQLSTPFGRPDFLRRISFAFFKREKCDRQSH